MLTERMSRTLIVKIFCRMTGKQFASVISLVLGGAEQIKDFTDKSQLVQLIVSFRAAAG